MSRRSPEDTVKIVELTYAIFLLIKTEKALRQSLLENSVDHVEQNQTNKEIGVFIQAMCRQYPQKMRIIFTTELLLNQILPTPYFCYGQNFRQGVKEPIFLLVQNILNGKSFIDDTPIGQQLNSSAGTIIQHMLQCRALTVLKAVVANIGPLPAPDCQNFSQAFLNVLHSSKVRGLEFEFQTLARFFVLHQPHMDLSLVSRDGDSALHFAVRHCADQVQKIASFRGSDIHRKNSRGETPFSLALPRGLDHVLLDEPHREHRNQLRVLLLLGKKEAGPFFSLPLELMLEIVEYAVAPEKAVLKEAFLERSRYIANIKGEALQCRADEDKSRYVQKILRFSYLPEGVRTAFQVLSTMNSFYPDGSQKSNQCWGIRFPWSKTVDPMEVGRRSICEKADSFIKAGSGVLAIVYYVRGMNSSTDEEKGRHLMMAKEFYDTELEAGQPSLTADQSASLEEWWSRREVDFAEMSVS